MSPFDLYCAALVVRAGDVQTDADRDGVIDSARLMANRVCKRVGHVATDAAAGGKCARCLMATTALDPVERADARLRLAREEFIEAMHANDGERGFIDRDRAEADANDAAQRKGAAASVAWGAKERLRLAREEFIACAIAVARVRPLAFGGYTNAVVFSSVIGDRQAALAHAYTRFETAKESAEAEAAADETHDAGEPLPGGVRALAGMLRGERWRRKGWREGACMYVSEGKSWMVYVDSLLPEENRGAEAAPFTPELASLNDWERVP